MKKKKKKKKEIKEAVFLSCNFFFLYEEQLDCMQSKKKM